MKAVGEIEMYKGGLGDTAMQRAWMRYADANEVPHDHEDEEAFKYGYITGHCKSSNPQKIHNANVRATLTGRGRRL